MSDPLRAAAAWADRQVEAGLLGDRAGGCDPNAAVERPLHVQFHGEREPDFDRLAYRLEQRWSTAPKPVWVYWPSVAFGRLHGIWAGASELDSPHKVSHDLLCSAVWRHYWETAPDQAVGRWVPERKLWHTARRDGRRGPIPDALLTSDRRPMAIEVGGSYPADWLRHHARRFALAGWNWVLW